MDLHPRAQTAGVALKDALHLVDLGAMPTINMPEVFKLVPRGRSVAQSVPASILEKHGTLRRLVKEGTFNFDSYGKRQRWGRPSQTITKTYGALSPIHPDEHRHFSIGELKRIGSFPDPFKVDGTFEDCWARVGNSVPPLFMRELAAHVREVISVGRAPVLTGATYKEKLDAAWAQHLAPRSKTAPTVMSTFAGAGGSSLGYRMAGYKTVLAVEWDAHAVATYKANFPTTPVYHGDIAKLSVADAMKLAGIGGPGELDVLDGSPPCQGFSTAGKRQMDDPRNQLFREYVRLLRGLKPKAFVMENVSGMVKGKMLLTFAEAMKELKASGYKVECRLMNAMYFGVPQSRQRVIFVGVRKDLSVDPSHPKAQTIPIPLRDVIPKVAEASGMPPQLTPKYRMLAPKIRPLECAADHDPGKGFQNLVRASWAKPSMTLTKMNPGNGRGTPLHPVEHRSLSIPEAKRIGSFPDQFVIEGKFIDCWARIGNSVPPLFMRSIATHIKTEILRSRA